MIDCRLKEIAEDRGYNMSTVSRLTGIDKGTMSRVARGMQVLPLNDLRQTCKILGCSIEDLYDTDLIVVVYMKDILSELRW